MKIENKILICIFIFALAIRILFVFSTPLRWWDETVYANLGYDLSINPLDYSFANNGWSDFIPYCNNDNYCWPNAGFRAPLLPYALSIFFLLKLGFLTKFFIPFVGALGSVFLYFLGRKFFNREVGILSAALFAVVPMHVYYSSKILTDVFVTFFVILAFISFWKGYEEGKKKYKVLFGVFLALSLLARYTVLWIAPVFLIYFLIRDKSLCFLKDKYLWLSVLAFFIILIPWMIYGAYHYSTPLGAFIHGFKAASYWGGIQNWSYFFQYWGHMFSIIGIIFVFSLIYIFYKKEFLQRKVYLLLIWIFFFLAMAMVMGHKEDRFIMPIVPGVCILSGFFLERIKKYKKTIFLLVFLILLASLYFRFSLDSGAGYTKTNTCFFEGNRFIETINENAVIITEQSPLVYYYSRKETHFYPNPWSLSALENLSASYQNKSVYILFSDFDKSLNDERNIKIKEDISNFEKVFECARDGAYTAVYRV